MCSPCRKRWIHIRRGGRGFNSPPRYRDSAVYLRCLFLFNGIRFEFGYGLHATFTVGRFTVDGMCAMRIVPSIVLSKYSQARIHRLPRRRAVNRQLSDRERNLQPILCFSGSTTRQDYSYCFPSVLWTVNCQTVNKRVHYCFHADELSSVNRELLLLNRLINRLFGQYYKSFEYYWKRLAHLHSTFIS